MSEIRREAQVCAGPFAVWVLSTSKGKGSWMFIKDIAPVFQKFKGQRFSNLVGWLSSKYGYCEVNPLPLVETALSGYGSRQGRLFR